MRSHRGLTLLEMMIVLIIASMAMALGFESLSQWQRAEESLERVGSGAREATLSEVWWRESVRGTSARFNAKVTGDASKFTAITNAPVLGGQGSTTEAVWSLHVDAEGARLELSEFGRTLALSLPDTTQARFMYLDTDGELQTQWPPRLGVQADLPAAIALLQTGTDERQRIWLAPIIGGREPYYQAFELEAN